MATKQDLANWVQAALNDHGGKACIVDVAKHIWDNHENDLRSSGKLFFTWQYDMRWGAQKLRNSGVCKKASHCPQGIWELAK